MGLDQECKEMEEDALGAIIDYMKSGLNGKIAYTSPAAQRKQSEEMVSISKTDQDFWEKCTQVFAHEMDGLFAGSRVEFETGEDLAEKDFGIWVDTMQHFKDTYEALKREFSVDGEQESKCDELFLRLCKRKLSVNFCLIY